MLSNSADQLSITIVFLLAGGKKKERKKKIEKEFLQTMPEFVYLLEAYIIWTYQNM